ncbi:TrmB family transcriptional regulator [Halobaculum sp. MBLA0143]|uniref:TrmB family transcriptional regulator n=1 Tax=Halobaculum sp. MBLA0143 TaxID=3079933 RepID=UPI003524A9C5
METDALVDTLQDAGLSPYQANAYVALLELGVASATEVAEVSDVPAPRIYDVLGALEDQGYIETYEQNTLHARAHSPTDVLEDLRTRSDRFERAADEVEDRWEQPELEGNEASIVSRFRTVLERAETFVDEAAHQVLLSTTTDHFRRLRPSLEAAYDRGVSVRVSLHTERETDVDTLPDPAGVATEVRHRPLPAPFLALADRRRACFAHHPEAYDQYGVLISDRTHTFVFYWYFLTSLWEQWEPVHDDQTDGLPVEYMDIRNCARDLSALDLSEHDARLRVEGYDVDTGEERELVGTVEAIRCPVPVEPDTHVVDLVGQVTLDVRTEEGTVPVGGWGALIEDVEATRITLLSVEPDPGSEWVDAHRDRTLE